MALFIEAQKYYNMEDIKDTRLIITVAILAQGTIHGANAIRRPFFAGLIEHSL
jgi:hypothetical protein